MLPTSKWYAIKFYRPIYTVRAYDDNFCLRMVTLLCSTVLCLYGCAAFIFWCFHLSMRMIYPEKSPCSLFEWVWEMKQHKYTKKHLRPLCVNCVIKISNRLDAWIWLELITDFFFFLIFNNNFTITIRIRDTENKKKVFDVYRVYMVNMNLF